MKILRSITFVLALTVFMGSCEKDDICIDFDTPFLVFGFFDSNDSITPKQVPSLRILEIERNIPIDYDDEDPSEIFPYHEDLSTTDSTLVPLKVNDSTITFILINNYTEDDEGNVSTGTSDTLTLSYGVRERFVSRACGFIANYDLDTLQPIPTTTNWIRGIEVGEPEITASNQVHVKIYH